MIIHQVGTACDIFIVRIWFACSILFQEICHLADAGIILSHSVLRAVSGKLSWCTRNTYSETDTDNLGRCILHATDLPCASSMQVMNDLVIPLVSRHRYMEIYIYI